MGKKNTMFLITHSGSFHCDEVTSTAIFILINKNCVLLRTRDLKLITCLISQQLSQTDTGGFLKKYSDLLSSPSNIAVYDVYGVYDADRNLFDHHQRGFTDTFYDDKFKHVRMSSAGLVFKHFNKQLARKVMENCSVFSKVNVDEFLNSSRYEEFLEHVYEDYFLGIDANDNGIENTEICPVRHRYWPQIVNLYNKWEFFGEPTGFELENISTELSEYIDEPENKITEDKSRNNSFNKAVEVARQDLELYLRTKLYTFSIYYDLLIQQTKIADQYERGQIVHWKKYDTREVKNTINDQMFKKKYLLEVFPNTKFFIESPEIEGGQFRIYGAPVDLVSYACKAYLKEEWRGHRNEKLIEISKMENIEFVHLSGFTGGAKDIQTAIQMCIESLEAVVLE